MDSSQREALALRILSRSKADQTEAVVSGGHSAVTRFAHNAAHQNVSESDVSVNVRAIVGKRTGVAGTNAVDERGLQTALERAIEMARLAPEDPWQPQLPRGGNAHAPEGAYVQSTAETSPEQRARMCDEVFEAAQEHGCWCAGFVADAEIGVTIANTSGARSSFDGTQAALNVKMNAADSAGYAEAYHNDAALLDARGAAARSAHKARDSAHPRAVEPGEWTVILEPAAFGELFSHLADHFSAQTFDEGASFLSDGLDRPYLGANVTVTDDYANPLAPGMPFDYEGQPTQRLALIDGGVAKNVVTDSRWAHKLGRENTGHALPAPNAYGPAASHLVVSPGSASVSRLIAQTQRGLLISRFWYIRTVDRKKAIVTGMTRDGTFLIENGEIACGVRNMRFNQSILNALRRCEFGNELQRTGGYDYSIVVPAAKIEGFTFSSGTAY